MGLDLAFVVLLAPIAAGLGLRGLRLLDATPDHPADRLALAIPLGLGLIGLATLGLGECGMLGRWGVLSVLVVAGLWGWRGFARNAPPHPALPHQGGGFRFIPPPWWGRAGWGGGSEPASGGSNLSHIWGALILITLLGTLLTALTPVTDGDALCYHLQVPKVFLSQGSVGYEPDLHETIYPLLTEMLYADALALRGPVACRLVQWLLGLTLALNVTAMARPILGDRARWAGALALLVPAVSNGMGAPLNDVALAAFGNAAIVGFLRWLDRPGWRASTLAGVLAGLAMGVKYPALVLTGVLGLAMLGAAIRARRTDLARQAVLFVAAAVAVGGIWYLRAYGYTGNPVFPFFRRVFGGSGLDEVLGPEFRRMAVTPWNVLTAIGPMTLDPARFDSVSHQFGPLFLLALPALLLERAPRRAWLVVAIGYAFLTLCLTQRQSMRFVLIAVGPLSVGVAWVASRWADRPTFPARALTALVLGCLGFEATIALARSRHGIGVVLGRESPESYLTRREPTYRVGRWVDAHLPASARIVGQDHRGYYIPRPYSMELAHRRRTGLGTRGESADRVVELLRRDGFTHLLLCPPEPEDAVEFDPTLGRLLRPWLGRSPTLYREAITDPDGVRRTYEIHALGKAGSQPEEACRR